MKYEMTSKTKELIYNDFKRMYPSNCGPYTGGVMSNVKMCYLEIVREAVKHMHPESRVVIRFRGPRPHSAYCTHKADATGFSVYLYSK